MPNFGGELPYVISELVVASWTSNGSYGTPYTLENHMKMVITPVYDNDTLKSGGMNRRALSVAIGAECVFDGGGMTMDGILALCGIASSTSGTTPNQHEFLHLLGGVNLGYFGVVGRAPADDGGALQIGLYQCKLRMFPELTIDQNKFVIAEYTADAVARSSDDRIITYDTLETDAAINLATFLA